MRLVGTVVSLLLSPTQIAAIDAKRASAAGSSFYEHGKGPAAGDTVPLIVTSETEDGVINGHAFLNAPGVMFFENLHAFTDGQYADDGIGIDEGAAADIDPAGSASAQKPLVDPEPPATEE